MSENTDNQKPADPGLVSIETLREALWPDPASRPSVRWLRELQAKRMVPFLKIGSKVYFEPERVRAALRRFEQPVDGAGADG